MSKPAASYPTSTYVARPWAKYEALSAERLNRLAAEIRAIQQTLSTNPNGTASSISDLISAGHITSGTDIARDYRVVKSTFSSGLKDYRCWAGKIGSHTPGVSGQLVAGSPQFVTATIGSGTFDADPTRIPYVFVSAMRSKDDPVYISVSQPSLSGADWQVTYRAEMASGGQTETVIVAALALQLGLP